MSGVRGHSLETIVLKNLRWFAENYLDARRGRRRIAQELWDRLGQQPLSPIGTKLDPLATLYLRLGGCQTQTYFVGLFDAGRLRFIKIGSSSSPPRRLEEFRTSVPLEVRLLTAIPADLCDEYALHHAFRGIQRHREWFASTVRIRRFIEEVQALEKRAGWVWAT